jgi:hypothetical protein
MSRAPVGAVVKLYVDLVAVVVAGDIVKTEAGRCYRILAVRTQLNGKHIGRQHLQAVVTDVVPERATVHTIRWYKRRRRA